jgi:hypothetical protein
MKKTRRRSKRRARLTTLDILATVLAVIAFAGEILAYTEYISHNDGLLINGFAVLGLEIVYNRGRLPRNFSFASYSRRVNKSSYNENDSSDFPTDSPTTQFPERRKGNLSKRPLESLPQTEVSNLDSSSEKETKPSQPTEDNNLG